MFEDKELRNVYMDALMELAAADERVVLIDADLGAAFGAAAFKKRFPDRYLNVGIAEANMIGVAAGLAASGKIPFVQTFTTFVTRRCFDQIFISVGYAGLNVKIVGGDPGIAAEANGGTHMSLEDVALMRTMPNMLIFEPVDSVQLRAALPQILQHEGPVYLHFARKKVESIIPGVFGETYACELGKTEQLRDGKDLVIFAAGLTVHYSLEAARLLAAEGIEARVVNVHTLPLDEEGVLKAAETARVVVTVENHNVIGGLGSAVAELLSERLPKRVCRVGARNRYGEVGLREPLAHAFGIDAESIAAVARNALRPIPEKMV